MKATCQRLTNKMIAESANIKPDFFSHIIRGRRPCPRDAAVRLETSTGISRVTWVWGSPNEIQEALVKYKDMQRELNGY